MTSESANEKALFALMGIQLGALNASQVATLFAQTKTQSELATRLVEMELLDASQRKAIDSIVIAELAQYDGDAAAAMGALLQASPGLQEVLTHTTDQEVSHAGQRAPTIVDESAMVPPDLAKGAAHGNSPRRFRILRFHDEGGLGQVFEAEDQELDRNVAVKEIQVKLADDAASRHRFEREARITGALEHPGIVPVYGLGHYEDGRPYYAMRMIRGESLRDAIRTFHALPRNRSHEGERVLAQRRLLGQFLDVCNAIGYAHQRGVLHRDIKPGNIMLGNHGETLVVDWGLAKRIDVINESREAYERPLKSLPDDDQMHTMIGHAVGSPLYMSPEQARGDIDGLSPATDIYSLGATLYTILTDQSAVGGDSKQQVLENVRRGKTKSARAANPEVPKPLSAICEKAMQFRPEDRYAMVGSLAADIERYLGDEPVSAYHENGLERAWRYVRKHRNKFMAAVAASIVVAVSAIAAMLVGQSQREQALAEREEALAVAEQRTMVNFVQQLYTAVPTQAGKSGLFVDYLTRVDKQLGPRYLKPDAAGYNPNAHAALTWFLGSAYMPMGMYTEAVTFLEKHLPIVKEQTGETMNTTLVMDKLANSYVQIGKPHQAISIFKDIIRIREQLGVTRRESIRTYDNLARAHVAVGDYAKAIALREQVLEWSRTLEPIDEKRIASALHNLGLTYLAVESTDKALALLQEAHQLRRRVLSAANTKTISAQQGVASALSALGKHEQAQQLIEEIYKTCQDKYGENHRITWRVFEDRCKIKLATGDTESLADEAQLLVAARQMAYEPGHPQWFQAQLLLAEAKIANGDTLGAITQLASAASHTRHRYQVDAQAALGDLYLRNGDFQAAQEALTSALLAFPDYYAVDHKLYRQLLLDSADAHLAMGEFGRANEKLQRALSFIGGEKDLHEQARIHIGTAMVASRLEEREMTETALAAARELLEQRPSQYLQLALELVQLAVQGSSDGGLDQRWLSTMSQLVRLERSVPPRLRFCDVVMSQWFENRSAKDE